MVIWTGTALIVIIVARQTRHREGCGTDFEVGVDDEIKFRAGHLDSSQWAEFLNCGGHRALVSEVERLLAASPIRSL